MALANYRLRVGARPIPAWRTAMVDTDKVYEIGGLPSVLSSSIDWPAAGSANFLMNGGGDSNAYRLHASYGGSVFVPELGAYGTMVFGRTGEATIDNQMIAFPLSDDAPAWAWFQQPDYPISEAEAITAGADAYYSEADYAALDSAVKIDGVGEATFAATWSGTFPVGYKNWVIRRKFSGSFTGNGRPHCFRYNMPCYIPPAMTGTANGAIVVNDDGTIYGPFSQGPLPSGVAAVDWFVDMWGGSPNRNKKYLYAMDVQTKAWTRLEAVPDYARNDSVVIMPIACVDETAQRVYYWTINGSNNALYYADFSSGIAGLTISSPASLTDSSGGAAPDLDANSVLCEIVGGALDGKKFWYMRDSGSTPALLLIDIGANTLRKLTITGLPTDGEWWALAFDAATQRLIITTKSVSLGVKSYRAAIPTDYTNEAAYSFDTPTIDQNSITVETGSSWQYGDRGGVLVADGAILMTQLDGKMLSYLPGA